MEDKVLPTRDKPPNFRQTIQRRKHIMLSRIAGSCDIEELLHGAYYTSLSLFTMLNPAQKSYKISAPRTVYGAAGVVFHAPRMKSGMSCASERLRTLLSLSSKMALHAAKS